MCFAQESLKPKAKSPKPGGRIWVIRYNPVFGAHDANLHLRHGDMIVARRFLISGRVQGVGFRFFAEEVARREGLGGFVRNRADGGVETVVEGEEESVTRFERAMRQGPPLSRVEAVKVEPVAPTGRQLEFVIRG